MKNKDKSNFKLLGFIFWQMEVAQCVAEQLVGHFMCERNKEDYIPFKEYNKIEKQYTAIGLKIIKKLKKKGYKFGFDVDKKYSRLTLKKNNKIIFNKTIYIDRNDWRTATDEYNTGRYTIN